MATFVPVHGGGTAVPVTGHSRAGDLRDPASYRALRAADRRTLPGDRGGGAHAAVRGRALRDDGQRSLFDAEPPPPSADRRPLPAGIRVAIVALTAEYPPFGPFEIVRVCHQRVCGHAPVSKTKGLERRRQTSHDSQVMCGDKER